MSLRTVTLDLLFPPKCPFCQKILEQPRDPLCPDCQTILPWLTGPAGEKKVDFSAGCYSPLIYEKRVREAVHRYKFSRVRAYAQPFGTLLTQCVQDHLTQLPDAVTWTPLSAKRLRTRGFDQAELLARTVGERLSLPVLPTLVKTRDTQPQSELEEESARRANAMGAYSLRPDVRVEGLRLLLVDDVVTTGATFSECSSVLLRSGAAEVYCAAVAQTHRK